LTSGKNNLIFLFFVIFGMEQLENYLKPGHWCESKSDSVINISKTIVGNSKSAKDKVKKIALWVRDKVKWQILPLVGAESVLKRSPLAAICIDKTNLFVALCRAQNIPAKYVLMMAEMKPKNNEMPPNAMHAAAEVYIDGKWKFLDISFGKGTENIMPLSTWDYSPYEIKKEFGKFAVLPLWMRIIANIYIAFAPDSKVLRKIVNA